MNAFYTKSTQSHFCRGQGLCRKKWNTHFQTGTQDPQIALRRGEHSVFWFPTVVTSIQSVKN